ncbi:MAG: hypothetical protein K2L99_06400, partial [Muribaculaceae bacterium]|nr:hypothetical protein [Muribaculaceae bacterium]
QQGEQDLREVITSPNTNQKNSHPIPGAGVFLHMQVARGALFKASGHSEKEIQKDKIDKRNRNFLFGGNRALRRRGLNTKAV